MNEANSATTDGGALLAYRSEPGRTAGTAYHKTKRPLPSGICAVHRDDDAGAAMGRPARFFKLVHHLDKVARPALADGLALINIFDDAWTHQIASVIDAAYNRTMDVDGETVRSWRISAFADPDLWVGIIDKSGNLVGCSISEFDPEVPEGILEWVQVHPEHHGHGIGKALVLDTLQRLKDRAAFAVVTGDLDNPTSPEALYRTCGFTGADTWHVYTT